MSIKGAQRRGPVDLGVQARAWRERQQKKMTTQQFATHMGVPYRAITRTEKDPNGGMQQSMYRVRCALRTYGLSQKEVEKIMNWAWTDKV